MSPAEARTGTIAVVEDDPSIRELLELYLGGQGYRVVTAESGSEADRVIAEAGPDLVVLDIMLPDRSGFDILKGVRAVSQTPVIILTARDAEQDKILGLELGADDYVTKPFSPGELVARVRAVLRRAGADDDHGVVRVAEVEIFPEERVARAGGASLELTPKEFDLLHYLLVNRGLALSRERLLEEVWGYTFYGDARTVDAHIRQLRKKLDRWSPLIQTVWGVGYKLDPDAEVPSADAVGSGAADRAPTLPDADTGGEEAAGTGSGGAG